MSGKTGAEFHNHGSCAGPRQSTVDSCLRTIVRRLPNLSAPKELPAAQPSACCRLKAWFQPPTGSRWKSTKLSVTAYAEHKPLLAGDHFSPRRLHSSIAGGRTHDAAGCIED